MNAEDGDVIDFKPFFDLVVGVIFILLILIAAQMFFAQQQPETETGRAERAAEVARRAEALRFLDGLAADLAGAGFRAEVDRVALAIVVPGRDLVRAGDAPACARPQIDREAAARFAGVLAGRIACLAQAPSRPATCPAVAFQGQPDLRVDLHVPAVRPGATPEAGQRALALDLAAGLFSARPDLLDLRTGTGALMVDQAFGVRALQTGAGADACGEVRLGFPLLDRPAAP